MTVLDEDQRQNRLVLHLAKLVRSGAEIEHHHGVRAIVRRAVRPVLTPNVIMAAIGVALYFTVGGLFFLLGAVLALVGLHRKVTSGEVTQRLLVRVDELGRVKEMELEA
jgi:hypothetical protein